MTKKSNMVMSCAYGKGNLVSVIFLALSRLTKPRDSVWYTRERIGGAIGRTPSSRDLVTSVWNRCRMHSTRLKPYSCLHSFKCFKVEWSMPKTSRATRWSVSAISSRALPWHKLINLIKACRKFITSLSFVAFAPLENVTKQLTASNHSPRIWCKSDVPSQKRDSACAVRNARSNDSTADAEDQVWLGVMPSMPDSLMKSSTSSCQM
mmetsp:Transcript_4923/g.6880  ORF Transcript_4923/g.6880 Transcript_4923/m.6880 type:complete len:207 (+) Transcript_4923:115-735(+)